MEQLKTIVDNKFDKALKNGIIEKYVSKIVEKGVLVAVYANGYWLNYLIEDESNLKIIGYLR